VYGWLPGPLGRYQTDAHPLVGRVARGLHRYSTVKQPNNLQTVIAEVDVAGEQHLVKFSRYYDNAQFWTVPGERDEQLHARHTDTVTEPEPEEFELYDLTLDPFEKRTSPTPATPTTTRVTFNTGCSSS
jgi:hypothetical protein